MGTKWVYTIKTDQSETYKARFVERAIRKYPTYIMRKQSHPQHARSIRTLLQHAVQNDLIVHQIDVKAAYLNAPIDQEIYIEQPEGFRKSGNITT